MSRPRVAWILLASGACIVAAVVVWTSGWLGAPTADAQPQGRTPFAADRAGAATVPVAFDGKKAMEYLGKVCDLGPRISGTAGMRKQQELLRQHFEALGAKVVAQSFTARQISQRAPVDMANLVVSWHPERKRRVLVCSHYDTRPIADQEPDPHKWHDPFVSANDGGSGLALLMELGRHMKDLPAQVGIDFVFFDGEEYIFDKERDKYFFGSQHFADAYRKNRSGHQYVGAVLLDMIAGPNPHFPVEQNSFFMARALTTELWTIAEQQKCTAFRFERGPEVLDDHLALNRAGIPAVDIIDFDYPHWHRLSDRPENCSPEGMTQVARVLGVWLQRAR